MLRALQDLLKRESTGGILLLIAAIAAIALNNSSWDYLYSELLSAKLTVNILALHIEKPLLHWINDGLMVIFFLLVGLEIKREVLKGVLKNVNQVLFSGIGALGGLLIPMLIYVGINYDNPESLRGWAIPTATDIAFSLGILSLLGSRVPIALKIFLTALAIIDDIAAIIIIALFYTADLSFSSMMVALFAIVCLILLNRFGVKSLVPYFLFGLLLWVSVLKSGVHATLAGIVLAFIIPIQGKRADYQDSPLMLLERDLLPWVTFLVLPAFAFANAGFSFDGLSFEQLFRDLPLGILLGLFVGKQVGIFSFCWLLIKCGWCSLPKDCNWLDLYGIALLCGVGFTMSLFIGGLAFDNAPADYTRLVRVGVLAGSFLSGICGYGLLRYSLSRKKRA